MTLRLPTCSSLAILLLLAPALAAGSSVTGRVELIGSQEPHVRKHHDFSGVVIWLQPVDPPPQHGAPHHVQMIQKDKRFDPHILAIDVGTTVDFPNFDPIFHNAFSSFNGQVFDIGLYAPGSSKSIRFDRPGIVRVFCNIHPTMSAVIAVLDSPYFVTTESDGAFTITGLRAGDYELHVFHERSTPDTLDKLARLIEVPSSGTNLSPLTISESEYLPTPHKNKYGRDYPPTPDDQNGYSLPPQ
jgi:plastocyanin